MTEQLAAMPTDVEELNLKIEQAVAHKQLIASSAKNIRTLLEGAASDLYLRSVKELVHGEVFAKACAAITLISLLILFGVRRWKRA